MIKNEDWIPVTKGVPDKTEENTKIAYLVTIEVSDGARTTITTEWGPVNKDRLEFFENDKDEKKFLYDGWAFGDIWDGEIDTIDHVVAWMYMPKPFVGKILKKEEGDE